MKNINLVLQCPVHASFRTAQVAGMFDVPLEDKLRESFDVELPGDDEDWKIGLIVGPSGSGKSSVAAAAYGDRVWRGADWPADRAVIDCFGDLPTKQIVHALTAVGFSSPPSWVKPFHVLSNGEQFRCELARALLAGVGSQESGVRDSNGKRSPTASLTPDLRPPNPPTVFDEFTSVVDRDVAKVCSAAVAKAIRAGRLAGRFVAVTCHYDVAEWLEADWVLDMATRRLTRRRLWRPKIHLGVYETDRSAWPLFAKHHYLSGKLNPVARCFVAAWEDSGVRIQRSESPLENGSQRNPRPLTPESRPLSFAATLPLIGKKNHRRFTRIVTLPDYQGIGVGMALVRAVAETHRAEGDRVNVTSSHPALIAHCRRSSLWRCVGVKKRGASDARRFKSSYRSSLGRAVASFEFTGS